MPPLLWVTGCAEALPTGASTPDEAADAGAGVARPPEPRQPAQSMPPTTTHSATITTLHRLPLDRFTYRANHTTVC